PGKLERGQGHENARGDAPALRGQPRRREEPAPLPEEERGGEKDGAGQRADYRQEPEVERLTRSAQERAQPPRDPERVKPAGDAGGDDEREAPRPRTPEGGEHQGRHDDVGKRLRPEDERDVDRQGPDRKSTRLNSSHVSIS